MKERTEDKDGRLLRRMFAQKRVTLGKKGMDSDCGPPEAVPESQESILFPDP